MRRRQKGFTLIELTVVLAVVVALSGILVLRVGGWSPRQTLNASARSFGGALRVWRERARFDETSYRVTWGERAWVITAPDGQAVASGSLPAAQSFEAVGELLFDRRGLATPRSVALRHAGGARVFVVVHPLLSDPRYEEKR